MDKAPADIDADISKPYGSARFAHMMLGTHCIARILFKASPIAHKETQPLHG